MRLTCARSTPFESISGIGKSVGSLMLTRSSYQHLRASTSCDRSSKFFCLEAEVDKRFASRDPVVVLEEFVDAQHATEDQACTRRSVCWSPARCDWVSAEEDQAADERD